MAMNVLILFPVPPAAAALPATSAPPTLQPGSLLPAVPFQPPTWATQFSNRTMSAATIQLTVVGTGSVQAVATINLSNDGINWLKYVDLTTQPGTTNASEGITLQAPWRYIQAIITSITGGGTANVLVGIN